MKCPTLFDKAPSCLRKAERLIQRTKPLAALAAPVAIYEAAVQRFKDRYTEWHEIRQQAGIALGQRREAQIALDGQLRSLGMAIIAVHDGRRDSALFRMCFPYGYGSVLGLRPRDSLAIAEGLLTVIKDQTHPDIMARREPMRAAMQRLEAAVTAHNEAEIALSGAKALLDSEKLSWRDAHVDFYFAVRQTFRDRRRYVEDLFRVSGKRKSVEDEEQPEGDRPDARSDDAPPEGEVPGVPPEGPTPEADGQAKPLDAPQQKVQEELPPAPGTG